MTKMVFAVLTFALTVMGTTVVVDAAEIKVLSSRGAHAFMKDLGPQFEKATGNTLNIKYETTTALRKQIDAGEPFDLALLTAEVIDDLVKEGKITANTRTAIARIPIGIAIQSGLPKPDISSVDGLKRALLNAKSFGYTQGSASGIYVVQSFGRLGIDDAMKAKTRMSPVGITSTELVSKGEVQMNVDLIPEMLLWPNVEVVGPLPPELQNDIRLATGVASGAKGTERSKSLIEFLTRPSSILVIKATGMSPP